MKYFLFLFFLLLLACQYYPLNLPVFLSTLASMLIAIVFSLRNQKKQFSITLLLLLFGLISLGHHADLQYGLLEFNSEIYPVSIQDYLAVGVSFCFGYFTLGRNFKVSVNFIQIFACLSTVLISISFLRLQSGEYPVYHNPNWSGKLMLSFMLLSINFIFQGFATTFFWKKTGKKTYFNMAILGGVTIAWCINLLLLLSTGSRSATIALFSFLIPSLTYNYLLLFRKIARKKLFLTTSISILLTLFTVLVFAVRNSYFYNKLIARMGASYSPRAYIYNCYLDLFKENFFFGQGIGRTAQICEERLLSSEMGQQGYPSGFPFVNHAHNFILQIAADHGIVVLVIVTALLGLYIWQFCQFLATVRLGQVNRLDGIVVHICLTVFAIGLASLFQSAVYHVPFLQIWMGLLIGTSSAYMRSRSLQQA